MSFWRASLVYEIEGLPIMRLYVTLRIIMKHASHSESSMHHFDLAKSNHIQMLH